MSIEKRLLELAASFADEISRGDEERFKDRVMTSLELSPPLKSPRAAEGAGLHAGPRGEEEVAERP
ncbi:hypothetical protein AB0J83_07860 [Actinoplanes sp. NPDC049596]|uniref:hypothetical protein n=1 Tax=unclassified Actinoplanes TaxID=2626549 RepID=UPI00342720CB